MPHDTLPDAERLRAETLLRLTPVARIKMALELSDTVMRVAKAARARVVQADDSQPAGGGPEA